MRLARFVLAAVLVVGVISTANAANFVWWEAVGNNADSTVVGQGLGQNLDLECAAGAARCEWTVTMFLNNSDIFYGWSNALSTADPSISVKNFTYQNYFYTPGMFGMPGSFFPFTDNDPNTTAGSGPGDIITGGAITFGYAYPWYPAYAYYFPQYGGWPIFSFTLSKAKVPFVGGLSTIESRTGPTGYGSNNPPTIVGFGANAPVNAEPVGTPHGTVITINNVPEPATIALLGLGAMALIRRRR